MASFDYSPGLRLTNTNILHFNKEVNIGCLGQVLVDSKPAGCQSSSDNSAVGRKARTDVTLEPGDGAEI